MVRRFHNQSGLPNRFWQQSLRERPISTPAIEFTVAPRGFQSS